MGFLSLASTVIFCLPAFHVLSSNPDQPEGIGALFLIIASPVVFCFSLLACYLFAARSVIYLILASVWLPAYYLFVFGVLSNSANTTGVELVGAIIFPFAVAAPTLFARRGAAQQVAE